jgi:hypothetical protein
MQQPAIQRKASIDKRCFSSDLRTGRRQVPDMQIFMMREIVVMVGLPFTKFIFKKL